MSNLLSMALARIRLTHKVERLSSTTVPRLLSSALCVIVMSSPLSASASGLTPDQIQLAYKLSTEAQWPRARTLVTPHPLGLQTLSIEKQERKNQHTSRWASVYQYHYPLKSARVLLIDLESNTVTKQSSINTVHLPLNDTEIRFAKSLLSGEAALIELLTQELIRRGKSPLESLDELDVKASIYEPMSATHVCQKQRCALISLFDKTRTVFTIEPVVNLSTLEVETLDPQ